MVHFKNAYTILNVPKCSTQEEIKKAYLKALKLYNPENNPERFVIVRKAYETLTDPKKRAALDVYLYNLENKGFKFEPDHQKELSEEELESRKEECLQKGEEGSSELVEIKLCETYQAIKKSLWQKAADIWEEILQIDPGNFYARYNLFNVYSILAYRYALHEMEEEAIQLWKKALNLDPQSLPIIHNLAIAYEKTGDMEKTKRYWQETLKRWKKKLAEEPDNEGIREMIIELHRHFGGQLEQSKDNKGEAIEEYREILKINPDDKDTRVKVISALMRERKWEEAREEAEELLKKHPDDIELQIRKGWIMLNAGDVNGAFNYWKRVSKKYPDNNAIKAQIVKAHLSLAEKFKEKKQFNSALVHLKSATKYEKNNPQTLFQLGTLYELQGRNETAVNYYQKVMELDPKHKEAQRRIIKARMKR